MSHGTLVDQTYKYGCFPGEASQQPLYYEDGSEPPFHVSACSFAKPLEVDRLAAAVATEQSAPMELGGGENSGEFNDCILPP